MATREPEKGEDVDLIGLSREDFITAGEMRYRADITAGSLKVPESRIIADMLLRGIGEEV